MDAQMPRWQDAMERPCSRRKSTQDDTTVVILNAREESYSGGLGMDIRILAKALRITRKLSF
jgi:hypothetical protein